MDRRLIVKADFVKWLLVSFVLQISFYLFVLRFIKLTDRITRLWPGSLCFLLVLGLVLSRTDHSGQLECEYRRMSWCVLFIYWALYGMNLYHLLPFSYKGILLSITGFTFAYSSLIGYYAKKHGFDNE